METWKCKKCGYDNVCYYSSGTYLPNRCPHLLEKVALWERVYDEPEQKQDETVTDCNQLPDWCKVGEYVWCDRNGYGKIYSVREDRKSCAVYFRHGGGEFPLKAFLKFKQARLRPYNAEEMKALVGKTITLPDGDIGIVIGFCEESSAICCVMLWYRASDLLTATINGMPCGKLVHKEGDDWVE